MIPDHMWLNPQNMTIESKITTEPSPTERSKDSLFETAQTAHTQNTKAHRFFDSFPIATSSIGTPPVHNDTASSSGTLDSVALALVGVLTSILISLRLPLERCLDFLSDAVGDRFEVLWLDSSDSLRVDLLL